MLQFPQIFVRLLNDIFQHSKIHKREKEMWAHWLCNTFLDSIKFKTSFHMYQTITIISAELKVIETKIETKFFYLNYSLFNNYAEID